MRDMQAHFRNVDIQMADKQGCAKPRGDGMTAMQNTPCMTNTD
jgi:hypothetical protein